MQRVSAFLPSWEKRDSTMTTASAGASSSSRASLGGGGGLFSWPTRTSSRSSIASTSGLAASANIFNRPARLSIASVNSTARVQKEAFWPANLEVECDKAARILKSFCSDGYLAPVDSPSSPTTDSTPTTPTKIMKKIPRRVIQNAAGIAIFTCMRNGLWMTGSGGSGILVARKSDGTWSPPSGIMLHTPTLSFVIGVDVYDCILVVSDLAALEAMTRPRVTLGEDVGLVSGQSVSLESNVADFKWEDPGNTIMTYLKARGQDQHVNLTGCILTERANENERFYGSEVSQMDILAGNVRRSVEETKPLFEVIKMAEGRTDYDAAIISSIAATSNPGDAVIASPKSKSALSALSFGVPNADDPDPYGVLALEMAGLEIREAGSRVRPTSQLNVPSNVTSPTATHFNRQSLDTSVSHSNRGSYMSTRTVKSQLTDAGTQTADASPGTPSPRQSVHDRRRPSAENIGRISEDREERESVDYTAIDTTPIKHLSNPASIHSATSPEIDSNKARPSSKDDIDQLSKASSNYERDSDSEGFDDSGDDDDDVDDLSDDEPVIFEVAAVQPARTQVVGSRMVQAKGAMVTIPKRVPPPLPLRNPGRTSRIGAASLGGDISSLRSPSSPSFGDNARSSSFGSGSSSLRDRLSSDNVREEKTVDDEPKTPSATEPETFSDEPKTPSASRAAHSPTTDDSDKTPKDRQSLDFLSRDVSSPATTSSTADDTASSTKSRLSIDSATSNESKRLPDQDSIYESAVATPTSDRPFSMADDVAVEETPRKSVIATEKIQGDKSEEIEAVTDAAVATTGAERRDD